MTQLHKPAGIGIVGCGDISSIYIRNLQKHPDEVTIVSIAARTFSHAEAAAVKYGIPKAQTVEDLMHNPAVDIVLNLTIPAVHYSINRQALEAGKHVYSEKPLAIETAEAEELLSIARETESRSGGQPRRKKWHTQSVSWLLKKPVISPEQPWMSTEDSSCINGMPPEAAADSSTAD